MPELAGMIDCYQQEEKVLPEHPELVTNDEITYVDGVDDYGRYMIGCLFEPNYPEVEAYMTGWRWAEDNWFTSFLPRTAGLKEIPVMAMAS